MPGPCWRGAVRRGVAGREIAHATGPVSVSDGVPACLLAPCGLQVQQEPLAVKPAAITCQAAV